MKRLLETSVTLKGVTVDVAYEIDGRYLPENATDPQELPVVIVCQVCVNGEEITSLVGEHMDDIAEIIEQALDANGR